MQKDIQRNITRNKMVKTKVKWRDSYGDTYDKEFNTKEEANAFIGGAMLVANEYSCDDFYIDMEEYFEDG